MMSIQVRVRLARGFFIIKGKRNGSSWGSVQNSFSSRRRHGPNIFNGRYLEIYISGPIGNDQRFGAGSAFGMENLQCVAASGHATNRELPLFVGHGKEWVRKHTDVS